MQGGPPTVIDARFATEARDPAGLPAPALELAVGGRSNVGKSTLVNRLVGRRLLARTSKTPGRTRGIVFYDVTVRWPEAPAPAEVRLADLPGYGYARVSKAERVSWGALVEGYIQRAPGPALTLVLIDARRGPEEEERQMLGWLNAVGRPALVVATKTDKLSAAERGLCVERVARALRPARAPVVAVSAETGDGIDRLWRHLGRALGQGGHG